MAYAANATRPNMTPTNALGDLNEYKTERLPARSLDHPVPRFTPGENMAFHSTIPTHDPGYHPSTNFGLLGPQSASSTSCHTNPTDDSSSTLRHLSYKITPSAQAVETIRRNPVGITGFSMPPSLLLLAAEKGDILTPNHDRR